jgi:hypothetical protein
VGVELGLLTARRGMRLRLVGPLRSEERLSSASMAATAAFGKRTATGTIRRLFVADDSGCAYLDT